MIIQGPPIGRLALSILIVMIVFGKPLVAFSADGPVHLISTKLPGGQFEKKNGKFVGAFAKFFREASTQSGVPIDFRMVPWVRAVRETERSADLLLFPFTRTEQRESRFTWIAQLDEDRMCFASVGRRINSLKEARRLERVLVWRGTSNQAFLEKQEFKNLVIVSNKKRIIQMLKAKQDAAWYFICDEAQSYLDPGKSDITVKVGTPVASEVMWLAGGKSLKQTAAVDKFIKAIKILEKDKVLKKLLSEAAK